MLFWNPSLELGPREREEAGALSEVPHPADAGAVWVRVGRK